MTVLRIWGEVGRVTGKEGWMVALHIAKNNFSAIHMIYRESSESPVGFFCSRSLQGLSLSVTCNPLSVLCAGGGLSPSHCPLLQLMAAPQSSLLPGTTTLTSGQCGSLYYIIVTELRVGHSAVWMTPNPKCLQKHTLSDRCETIRPQPAWQHAQKYLLVNEKPRDCNDSTWSTSQFGTMCLKT